MAAAPPPQEPPASSHGPAPLVASCHCRRVQVTLPSKPTFLNECRCSVCYKYGALWAYFPRPDVAVSVADSAKLEAYARDDCGRNISFNRCSHCGCTTHWLGISGRYAAPDHKMGVNCRLLPESDIEGIDRQIHRL